MQKLGGLPPQSEGMTRLSSPVERLARELHRRHAPGAPFVAINCGAIPESLLEGELFGHAKGAFSGADADREGRIEAAAGGTLFYFRIREVELKLPPLRERTCASSRAASSAPW